MVLAFVGRWLEAGAAVMAVACGLAMMRRRGRAAAGVVELHEGGLAQRRSGATIAIRFDEVAAITSDRRAHVRSGVRTERHCIATGDGRMIEFTNVAFERPHDLLEAIERNVYPRLRARFLKAFDAGETVQFGPFALNEDGVRVGDGALLPWREVAGVEVHDGRIEVGMRGAPQPTARSAALVPNAPILVEMIELAVEVERSV
jgi:hypothetical protein